jgi:hypothetical protein
MLRNLVTELIGVVLAMGRPAASSASSADGELIDDLVAANRILADQAVLDGFAMSAPGMTKTQAAFYWRAAWRRRS